MDNQITKLTSKLISLPSWVDDKTNESQVGEFIYDFLIKNTSLTVEKEFVTQDRFNIITKNSNDIENLIIGHIDTVQPSKSWIKNPIKPEIIGDKLYGLGACDMKSGIALMLSNAISQNLKSNTMFLFYIDEEYDFVGVKKFIQEYKNKIKPKQIISLDGLNSSISNGCRGLIEITCTIKGKSGHASVPTNGVNAINNSFIIINKLTKNLAKFSNQKLGKTSINLAYINGGQYQGENSQGLILGKQGNIIADICQFTLDIRPSSSEINANKIIDFIKDESIKQKVVLSDYIIRYDFGSWFTPISQIPPIINKFNQIDNIGYIDIQLLWQVFNQPICFTTGAGCMTEAHKPDEFVSIKKLQKLQKIINQLLNVKIQL